MKKNLEAAFARPHSETDEFIHHAQAGMTLRDYFAAKAMQGLIAADAHDGGCVKCGDKYIAPLAYEMADDMLIAREA